MGLEGMLGIHDPSTVITCDGKYYVYGTGRGVSVLTSSDGFTWQRGPRVFDNVPDSVKSFVPKNDGRSVWAPDIIKLNGEYYLYYKIISAAGGSGLQAAGATAVTAPFTAADSQLWKIDQLSGGSYRIASKAGKLVLAATGKTETSNGIALQAFTGDDAQRWVITAP
jgi:arabinan endo-1,5-alpha-L-arabinosidase